MKIITLIENTSGRDDLAAEHGLSLYIETMGRRILFDMGQTDAFIGNAEKLGVNLAHVDLAILSHGHYDHGGGLSAFLAINDHAPVYVSRHAFGRYYNGTEKYIGLDPALQDSDRIILTGDMQLLGNDLALYSCNDRKPVRALNPYGLNKKTDGRFVPDDFLHEQVLLIEEGEKRILVSGCSHKGVVNLVSWFRPDVLVGGFHLMRVTDEQVLCETADVLMEYPAMYYTGHCTGQAQFDALKPYMGDRLHAICAGCEIEV